LASPSLAAICSSYASPPERALAKMVGFEVTPTTASRSIARASAPDSSGSQERKSIQTLWPWAASWWSRVFTGMV
jgi:hypothetical protein